MGAVCELPTANSPDGQKDGRPSKQRTLRITKKELPIPLVNTVQGFVRTELKAIPLNTDLVVPREVMDLILFFYALQPEWWSRMKAITWAMVEQDPKKRTQFRIVDLVYAEQPDGSTEMALQCQIPTPKPRKKRGGNFNEQMLESMGKFYRGLSLSSKQKLWSNAVKVDQTAGTSKVLDATFNLNHIEQLLCDLVVQYMEVYKVTNISPIYCIIYLYM